MDYLDILLLIVKYFKDNYCKLLELDIRVDSGIDRLDLPLIQRIIDDKSNPFQLYISGFIS